MGRLQIALLFLAVCSCTARMGFSFTCKEAERNALLKIKHGFNDTSNRLGSWMGQECCSWRGVGCDTVTSNVIKLDLRVDANNYSSCLVGEVNPAILELKYLRYLDLSGNLCSNTPRIPEFLGSMRRLQYLNLSNTFFGGKVPSNLGNLTELVVLDLSSVGSSWLEVKSLEWAFKLEKLQYLDMSKIDLSQALDSLNILHKLPSLLVLKFSNCQLGSSHQVIRNSTISSSTLQHLDLSGNLFSGSIPHFIQNLSSIKFLDISYNGLNSSIPSWFFNRRNLEYLSLNNNHFNSVEGGIMNTISRLCSLIFLDLSYNQLREEVSESQVYNFSKCSRYDLMSLHMGNNNMSGQLPTTESLLSLQELDLSHNNFEIIPESFGKLLSLESVNLSYNHLSVVKQVNLANLSSLRTLDISSNFLTFELSPTWLPPFQLESLHILPSKLNSPFPKWLLNQEKISKLDLSNAGIYGPLPFNIGNGMPSLRSLKLANNNINGSIPKSLCKLASLEFLSLQKNRLSGKIPNCWEKSQIIGVDLSSNKLSGQIPNSLAKTSTLQMLSLSNNSLEGELPRNCTKLVVLDVGYNDLHGEISTWNGASFPSLQILILRGNRFEGIIPPQLCLIHTLQIIDLASNNVTGTIPPCFGHFEGMGSMQQSNVFNASSPSASSGPAEALPPRMKPLECSAVEVVKGEEIEYTTVLHLLVSMDLSSNNLEGVIPAEITSLSRLVNLNLSNNHLVGTIPKEIGKMKSLESLDLSRNNLSGPISESISSLDFLSLMNLSFNNLQGQIPTGSQLQALEDQYSIYMGNPGLCGDPLPKCSGGANPPPSAVLEDEEEDDKHEKMWFYLVIMLGFATGFWGVIGILLAKSKWRHSYFRLAEDLAVWIHVRVRVRIARAKGGR